MKLTFLFSLIFSIVFGIHSNAQNSDGIQIGDLVFSILPPPVFNSLHNDESIDKKYFVLVSKIDQDTSSELYKKVTNTYYTIINSNEKLPLLSRGLGSGFFIRCETNTNFRPFNLQDCSIKYHSHSVPVGEGNDDGNHRVNELTNEGLGFSNACINAQIGNNENKLLRLELSSISNEHPDAEPASSQETRPQNFSIFIYIRIN